MKNKDKYTPITYVFDCAFNLDIHNEWLGENTWMIWDNYFKCFRYWITHQNADNFPYVIFEFDDIRIKLYFRKEEFTHCFSMSTLYFIGQEDYEMCAYIRDLAKEFNIELKLEDK